MSEKVREFLRQNLGYFVVAFVSIIYLSTALISMGKTGKTLSQIIADGFVVFLLGVFINRIFELQGLTNGERDEKMQNAILAHSKMVLQIAPKIDRLEDWCKQKNQENLKNARTRILSGFGMKYDDYFNADGSVKQTNFDINSKDKQTKKQEKAKLKCFNRALKVKLTLLSANMLTTEGEQSNDPYNFGRTKKQFESQSSLSDIFIKVGTALVFGYYGVELITNFSYADLIWKALQVAIFLIMGTIKMMNAYFFVVDELKTKLIKKTDNLQIFDSTITLERPAEKVLPDKI